MAVDIIGMSGKAETGKDYITNKYLLPLGYKTVSLSWHFKVWVVSTGQATYEEVFVTKPPHVRELLQQEGTERGRNVYGDTIWIDTLLTWTKVWSMAWGFNKFVIPDIRFQNELFELQKKGVRVYRILAPLRAENSKLTPEQKMHQSEIDLDNVSLNAYNGVIYNDYDDAPTLNTQMLKLLPDLQMADFKGCTL